MTPDQINRAIAEELGWKPKLEDGLWSMVAPNGSYAGKSWRGGISEDHCWAVCNLDFCNDHNAVAEMRKAIKPEERVDFFIKLMRIVGHGYFDMLNATPRQQAEAFLRMRGKWVEA